MLLRGALLQLALVSAAKRRKPDSGIDVGFCNSDGSGFMQKQPAEQMERWSLPVDNGTHLIVDWHPSSSVCGRNVSSYHVNVKTSLPIINMFVGAFGSFPQDLCAPGGSKAREAVSVQETVSTKNTCAVYDRLCNLATRRTTFEIPAALVQVTKWDIEVTVMGYGSIAPPGKGTKGKPVSWWCHKYRRRKNASSGSDGGAENDEKRFWLYALLPVLLSLPQMRRLLGAPVLWGSKAGARGCEDANKSK